MKQGDRIYIPCNCSEEYSDCEQALVHTEIVDIDGEHVTINDKRGNPCIKIPIDKIHVNPSILILCLGDIRSESTNLDPLGKSILNYCRLFHKDEGNIKYLKTRSSDDLKDIWDEFGGVSKIIIFISHGCGTGFTYGRNHKCSSAAELIEIFQQETSAEKKLFISLSCQTGSIEFGGALSQTTFCNNFIGPESKVHSASASQFCQTFLANYLMDGSNVIESFKKAKEAIPGTHGYSGSNDASHFGRLVPLFPVQMMPVITVLFVPVSTVQTVPL